MWSSEKLVSLRGLSLFGIWLTNVDFPRYMVSAQAGAFDFPSHYRDDSRAKESDFEEILII